MTFDPSAVLAVALERLTFGAPQDDGLPSEEARADAQVLLALLAEGSAGDDEDGDPLAYDAEFERKHPRGGGGRFGKGSRAGDSGAGESPRDRAERRRGERRAEKRKEKRRREPRPVREAPETQRQGFLRRAVDKVRSQLSPSALKAHARTLLHAATHPRETAGKAKDVALARLQGLRERYGIAGAAAIATAYVGYYVAAASISPKLLMIPVPLSGTLLTCAELTRWAFRRGKALLGYARDDWDEGALAAEVLALLAAVAEAHGEEAPGLDPDLLRLVLAELLDGEDGEDEEDEGDDEAGLAGLVAG